MGSTTTDVIEVSAEDRYCKPLDYRNPLAGNPGKLHFSETVRRADGSTLDVASPRATRLMVALMNMHAVFGGAAAHWGGPAAFAEIMSSIHGIMFLEPDWREAYNFVNDAGHTENGLYALKANYGFAGLTFEHLRGFRSLSSKLTGHGESHLFPEGVMVSNGPLGSSIPISQGLAMADRLARKDRTTICAISDGGMMEGEAREAVAAIPGLAAKGLCAPYILVISDNNTKLSGRIDDDSFSMQPTFESLETQGWNVIRCEQGNDLQEVFSTMEKAIAAAKADPTRPVAVWARTIKGYGVESAMKSASGGHGFPISKGDQLRPFVEEINGGPLPTFFDDWAIELERVWEDMEAAKKAATPSPVKKEKIQGGFARAMITAAEKDYPVVNVSADLQGSTGVAPFHKAFPHLSYDVGIAEANMVSTAAGFSKQGFIPVMDTFAQFGVTKGSLPLCMANLSQSPVIGVLTHIGFQDAADGASHQSLIYLSTTGSIPHLQQYLPASAEEAEWAMFHAIDRFRQDRLDGRTPDSVLFFCGRENFPASVRPEGVDYEWGKAMVLADTSAGKDKSIVISTQGSMIVQALEAVEKLAEQGIGAILLNNATPNHPDVAAHKAGLAKAGNRLVTVEEHQLTAGAGAMLTHALAVAGVSVVARTLGVQGEFGQSAYVAKDLYKKHGIDADGIAAAGRELV